MRLQDLCKKIPNMSKEGRKALIRAGYKTAEYHSKNRNEDGYKQIVRLLTRVFYDSSLPMECHYCHKPTKEIHHLEYEYPPRIDQVVRCCHKCNMQQPPMPIKWMEVKEDE